MKFVNTLLFLLFSTSFFIQNINSYEIFRKNDQNLNLSKIFSYNDGGLIGLVTFEKHNPELPIFYLFSTQNNTMVKNFQLKGDINSNPIKNTLGYLGLFFNYFAIKYNNNYGETSLAIINWNGETVTK